MKNGMEHKILYAEWAESLRRCGFDEIELIGRGAFAEVCRVRRKRDGRILACKSAEGGQKAEILAREAKLLSQISHPLFPRYADFFRVRNAAFLLMEYVDGKSPDEIIKREGVFEQKDAVRIAVQLAEGLRFLHEREEPFLYRDLKPENVCIMSDGRVRLLDLGCVCRMEEAGYSRAGSRGYAAPEQLDAENKIPCGPYSDVYALGRLLFYLLEGDVFALSDRRHSQRRFSPLLERLIAQCTEPDAQKRPPDMGEVLRQLEPLLKEHGMVLKGREIAARVAWLRQGRKWEPAFSFEKNVCRSPICDSGEGTNSERRN